MTTCNAAPAPGISHPKTTIEDETALDQEQHSAYRRLVGKIQWLAHTRPDISYGAKELARPPQAPTQIDNKKFKRMIRYLKGTRYWKHALRPTAQIQDRRIPANIDIYTDANWASCETTRKSTTGFVIHFLGATVHYGSRTQACHQQSQSYTQVVQLRRKASTSYDTFSCNNWSRTRSEHNPLDILTKFVPTGTLHRHLYKVGLPSQP